MLRTTATNLAISVLSSRVVSFLMSPIRNSVVPVFMLHRVENLETDVRGHTPELIRAALTFVTKHKYNCISLQTLIKLIQNGLPVPSRAVCFTMDDGFADQAEVILPLFNEFKVPITFFVATDIVDNVHWSWDFKLDYIVSNTKADKVTAILAGKPFGADIKDAKNKRDFMRNVRQFLKTQPIEDARKAVFHLADILEVTIPRQPPEQYRALNWEDARALESDYIEFAPHSCQHIVLTQLNQDQAKAEIDQSWERLKVELKNPCPIFCYPTGREDRDFTERDKTLVQEAKMMAAVSADPGYVVLNDNTIDLFAIRRFSLPKDNINQFKQYCSWIERVKELIRKRN